MRSNKQITQNRARVCPLAFSLALLLASIAGVRAADPPAKTYPTPLAAADALLTAGEQEGTAALLAVLGPGSKDIIDSGDETQDHLNRQTFVAAARDKTVLMALSKTSVFLMVGDDDWPFPIPIVKGPQGWFWDAAAGKQEILSRRIGRNELGTIALCGAYVQAQKEYAGMNPGGAGVGVYAQRLLSSEGKKDGLFWPAKEGDPQSPMGPLAAKAAMEGYSTKPSESGPKPFHGYLFKILTAQGKDAPGGAQDYLKGGKMTGGFALAAWPAKYGDSGIMTFLVNRAGIVFEKDLGPTTDDLAKAMDTFNPDLTWKPSRVQ